MPWRVPDGYVPRDMATITRSMSETTAPRLGGTFLAMRPIVFDGKRPFLSRDGTGETGSAAPLTPGQARTAFDKGWVPAGLVHEIAAIASADGEEWRAPI